MTESTTQLELFESLPRGTRTSRPVFHIGTVPVRHDHLVLVGLMALVTSSVVFAVGVERGKRLARVERTLVAPPSASAVSAPASSAKSASSSTKKEASDSGAQKDTAPALKATPAKPRKTPVKVAAAASVSKFAVQVVSYRQPSLAQQEMARLHSRGERAFLLKKSDRFAVLVGPFPSKAHATSKLSGLKQRYQDCFVKSL